MGTDGICDGVCFMQTRCLPSRLLHLSSANTVPCPHLASPRYAHSRRRDLRHSASAYKWINRKSLIGIFPGWQCYGIAYALGCVGHELVHINQWWSDLRCVCQASVFRYNSISILKNPATLLTGILTKSSHSPDGVLRAHAL